MHQVLTFAYDVFVDRRRGEIFVSNVEGQNVHTKTDSRPDESFPRSATKRYFHYLVPENKNEEASSDEEWNGRLAKLERAIKMEALHTEQSLAGNFTGQLSVHSKEMKELKAMCSETASLVDKMAHQSDETESWKKNMEERMDKMEASIAQVLQKLDPAGTSAE